MAASIQLRDQAIRAVVSGLSGRATPFAGVCYRCTQPQYADQLITGMGSQLHGGRWTPKNSFPTVYLCESAEAALQEFLARSRRMKLPDHRSLPMVMAWVKVEVATMLDLTVASIAKEFHPHLQESAHWRNIHGAEEAGTQAIGRAIKDAGFGGILAPSNACAGAKNVVIFPQNLKSTDILKAPSVKIIWK